METIEQRIEQLEQRFLEQHSFYMLLLNLILRNDDDLRLKIAKAIRVILMNPVETHPIPQSVRQQLQSLRDDLLQPASPEVVAAISRPPVRPVDK